MPCRLSQDATSGASDVTTQPSSPGTSPSSSELVSVLQDRPAEPPRASRQGREVIAYRAAAIMIWLTVCPALCRYLFSLLCALLL